MRRRNGTKSDSLNTLDSFIWSNSCYRNQFVSHNTSLSNWQWHTRMLASWQYVAGPSRVFPMVRKNNDRRLNTSESVVSTRFWWGAESSLTSLSLVTRNNRQVSLWVYTVQNGIRAEGGETAPCLTICWYKATTSDDLIYSPRFLFNIESRFRMLLWSKVSMEMSHALAIAYRQEWGAWTRNETLTWWEIRVLATLEWATIPHISESRLIRSIDCTFLRYGRHD